MWGIISNKRSERKKCVLNKGFLKHKKTLIEKWTNGMDCQFTKKKHE